MRGDAAWTRFCAPEGDEDGERRDDIKKNVKGAKYLKAPRKVRLEILGRKTQSVCRSAPFLDNFMFELDHVAIPSRDIAASAAFYVEHFGAQVLYQDETWAFLQMGQGKLALVTPTQHPPHVALRVDEAALMVTAKRAGKTIDSHRDGTRGIYVSDPDGNAVELICYPPGETAYESK